MDSIEIPNEELLLRMRSWKSKILPGPGTFDYAVSVVGLKAIEKELGRNVLLKIVTLNQEFISYPTVDGLNEYAEVMALFRTALINLGMEGVPAWVGPWDIEPNKVQWSLASGQSVRIDSDPTKYSVPQAWGSIVKVARDWHDERYVVKVLAPSMPSNVSYNFSSPCEFWYDVPIEELEPISEDELGIAITMES